MEITVAMQPQQGLQNERGQSQREQTGCPKQSVREHKRLIPEFRNESEGGWMGETSQLETDCAEQARQ